MPKPSLNFEQYVDPRSDDALEVATPQKKDSPSIKLIPLIEEGHDFLGIEPRKDEPKKEKKRKKKTKVVKEPEPVEIIPEVATAPTDSSEPTVSEREWNVKNEKDLIGRHALALYQYYGALIGEFEKLDKKSNTLRGWLTGGIFGKKQKIDPGVQEDLIRLKYKSEISAENVLDETFQNVFSETDSKKRAEEEVEKLIKDLDLIRQKAVDSTGLSIGDINRYEKRVFEGVRMPVVYHEADEIYAAYLKEMEERAIRFSEEFHEQERKRQEEIQEIGTFRPSKVDGESDNEARSENIEERVIDTHLALERMRARGEEFEGGAIKLEEQSGNKLFGLVKVVRGFYKKQPTRNKIGLSILLASGALAIGEMKTNIGSKILSSAFTGRLTQSTDSLYRGKVAPMEIDPPIDVSHLISTNETSSATLSTTETPLSSTAVIQKEAPKQEKNLVGTNSGSFTKKETLANDDVLNVLTGNSNLEDLNTRKKEVLTTKISDSEILERKVQNLIEVRLGENCHEVWKVIKELDASTITKLSGPIEGITEEESEMVKSMLKGVIRDNSTRIKKGETIENFINRALNPSPKKSKK